jgi:hypothetical protein
VSLIKSFLSWVSDGRVTELENRLKLSYMHNHALEEELEEERAYAYKRYKELEQCEDKRALVRNFLSNLKRDLTEELAFAKDASNTNLPGEYGTGVATSSAYFADFCEEQLENLKKLGV